MKFKYLNESEELWVSGRHEKEPTSQSKLSYCCHARPLKALLKTLSTPEEIEAAINRYTKTNKVKYVGAVEHDGSTFYRFDPDDKYGYDTFWYCRNYSKAYSIDKLKYYIPEGSVLVVNSGYSMRIYDFYRIEKYQGKSVVVSKLQKVYSDNSFKPIVRPGTTAVETNKYRLNIPKNNYSEPYIALDYSKNLYLDANRFYDKTKTYQEDHLD